MAVYEPHDVTAVLAAAKAVVIAEGQQILHVLPQYYTIDNHQRVTDPIGMFGVRLEAQVHIITGISCFRAKPCSLLSYGRSCGK